MADIRRFAIVGATWFLAVGCIATSGSDEADEEEVTEESEDALTTNLIKNGGFESGLSSWLQGGGSNGQIVVSTAAKHDGVYGLREKNYGQVSQKFTAYGGVKYRLSVWARGSASGPVTSPGYVAIGFCKDSGGCIESDKTVADSSPWQYVSTTLTIPASAGYGYVRLKSGVNTFDYDSVLVCRAPQSSCTTGSQCCSGQCQPQPYGSGGCL